MRTNIHIRNTLTEISNKALEYSNKPDEQRRYLRRILRTYQKTLKPDEQVYVLKSLLEMLHYRSIVTDPDQILALHNIRLRSYLLVFFMGSLSVIGVIVGVTQLTGTSSILEFLSDIFKILMV